MSTCEHTRTVSVSGKCSDMANVTYHDGTESDGYMPSFGLGGGDYVDLKFCIDCGVVLGFDMDAYTKALGEEIEKQEEWRREKETKDRQTAFYDKRIENGGPL